LFAVGRERERNALVAARAQAPPRSIFTRLVQALRRSRG